MGQHRGRIIAQGLESAAQNGLDLKIHDIVCVEARRSVKKALDELSFLGSTCTRDCSGHRAGYAWSKARAGAKVPMSRSTSFDKGAALQRAGR